MRTVKTASGATAVQVVWSSSRGSRSMDHIGSAHTPEDVEVLKAVARQRMIAAGQDELDFGDGRPRRRALPIRRSRAEHLWNALSVGFERLGFDTASGGDEVFKQLVLGRLIEPALEILRVLEEIGVRPCGLGDGEVSARRVCRAGVAAADSVRVRLSRRVGACHLGVVRREHALL